MKTLLVVTFAVAFHCTGIAQAVSTADSQNQGSAAQMPASAPVDAVLKKYVAAYDERNMQALLDIWPDLANQKKEFNKIKEHLTDARVSDEHMSLRPLETKTLNDDAIVQCERSEVFSKTETKSQFGGDLNMGASPAQSAPPTQQTSKTTVKKTDKVWLKLHKQNGNWQIVSVSTKPVSF
jgi:hypothetical protein